MSVNTFWYWEKTFQSWQIPQSAVLWLHHLPPPTLVPISTLLYCAYQFVFIWIHLSLASFCPIPAALTYVYQLFPLCWSLDRCQLEMVSVVVVPRSPIILFNEGWCKMMPEYGDSLHDCPRRASAIIQYKSFTLLNLYSNCKSIWISSCTHNNLFNATILHTHFSLGTTCSTCVWLDSTRA